MTKTSGPPIKGETSFCSKRKTRKTTDSAPFASTQFAAAGAVHRPQEVARGRDLRSGVPLPAWGVVREPVSGVRQFFVFLQGLGFGV